MANATPNRRFSLTVLRELKTPVPDPILDLVVQNPQATSLDLVWTEPALNGTTLTEYVVRRRDVTSGSTSFSEVGIITAPATAWTDTGLDPETEYEYQVKAVAAEGSGVYGNKDSGETTPDIPLFNEDYAFISVWGNAPTLVMVAIDNTTVTRNGATIATLSAGQTFTDNLNSQGDVYIGTGAFVPVARNGSNYYPLTPNYAVGKKFAYGPFRSNFQSVFLYPFQTGSVDIQAQGASIVGGAQPLTTDTPLTLTHNTTNQNVIVESDALMMMAVASGGAGVAVDQYVVPPAGTELVGFPSTRAFVYPTTPDTFHGAWRSNGTPFGGGYHFDTLDRVQLGNTGSQYSGDSVTIRANNPISAASGADSDGGKMAPFLATTLMRTRFGVFYNAERVAFASTQAFTVTTSNGNTYSSTGDGAAHRLRITTAADLAAGTLYTTSAPCGAWTEEPAGDDEIILFGVN